MMRRAAHHIAFHFSRARQVVDQIIVPGIRRLRHGDGRKQRRGSQRD